MYVYLSNNREIRSNLAALGLCLLLPCATPRAFEIRGAKYSILSSHFSQCSKGIELVTLAGPRAQAPELSTCSTFEVALP